jgi:hypothetical protein
MSQSSVNKPSAVSGNGWQEQFLPALARRKNNKREKRLAGDHHVSQWRINPLFYLPYKFVA